MMSMQDVKNNFSACKRALGSWDIVSLQDATVDGGGYGYGFHPGDSRRCRFNTKFLMKDDGRREDLKYINCDEENEI